MANQSNSENTLTNAGLEARRKYHREYRQRNPDKVRKWRDDYWNRKAERMKLKVQSATDNN